MSEKSAIVLVTTSFPISGDGSEAAGSFVSDLAEELANHLPVRVVAPGPQNAREKWTNGVDVFRYAAPEKPLSTLKPWHPTDFVKIIRILRSGKAATRTAVEAGTTIHIFALWAIPSGVWARQLSRSTGIPYSVWTLGSDIWTLGRLPLVRQYLWRVLRGAQSLYSDGLQLVKDTRRIAKREVEFLPSTRRIASKRSAPLKGAPPYQLLFLGRWHPNKGIDLLIDALYMLEDEDWRRIKSVEIYGGGPLDALVKTGVRCLQAAGRPVNLGGFLDKSQAEREMLYADWILIPSRIESIPLIFSDAMKASCPVVVTPVGDLRSLVTEGQCGKVSAGASSFDFCSALRQALSTSPLSLEAGVVNMAARFSLVQVASKIADRLTEVQPGSFQGHD